MPVVDDDLTTRNFYDTLGVHLNASAEVIRRAWKLAAWEHHPDFNRAETEAGRRAAEITMQHINEAYQTLTNPEKRRRYDLEMGLLPATCTRCGQAGHLRLAADGSIVALCVTCHPSL